MQKALITGATSGIGYDTALLFAKEGIHLVLCGRRQDRLKSMKESLEKEHPEISVEIRAFDVRDKKATMEALKDVSDIDILINNAGNAHGLAPIQEASDEDIEAMIDINVKGVIYVSKAIMPQMIERKRGHIINIGSVAGKTAYTKGNVYCASKAAVDSLTKGMRMDLLPFGIKVSAVHPGLVETEFSLVRFKGDQEQAKKVYEGLTPLTGQDIADLLLFMVTRPRHVNLADILIFPLAQAEATQICRDLKD